MLNIGPQELLLILVIALIVVGPQRLPELGRTLGKGLRELRKAQDEVKRTIQVNLDDQPTSTGTKARPTGRTGSSTGTADPDGEPTTDDRPADAKHSGTVAGAAAAIEPDPTPLASEPLPPSEVREISRTLGHGLAELRRAREQIQRSFRVDLSDDPAPRTPAPTGPVDVEPAAADDEASATPAVDQPPAD
jgi:Tat protein translocase TatB subunit